MRVSGAPQILPQWVLHVGRISDYKGKYGHPTDHHGRQDNQKDAGQKARSVSHDCLHSVRGTFNHNGGPRRELKSFDTPVEARGAGSDILDRRDAARNAGRSENRLHGESLPASATDSVPPPILSLEQILRRRARAIPPGTTMRLIRTREAQADKFFREIIEIA